MMRDNKKGVELSLQKLIVMVITAVVVIFGAIAISGIYTYFTDNSDSIFGCDPKLDPFCEDGVNGKGNAIGIDSKTIDLGETASYGSLVLTLKDSDYKKRYEAKVGPEFVKRVEEIAKNLGTKPEYLFAVMDFETGGDFTSDKKNNAGSGATGLIQFTSDTAKGLETSIGELEKMTPLKQLDYVEKHFQSVKGRGELDSLVDVYMAVFLPKGIGKDPEIVLSKKGDKYYDKNSGLDKTDDGKITVGEAAGTVAQNYNKRTA